MNQKVSLKSLHSESRKLHFAQSLNDVMKTVLAAA